MSIRRIGILLQKELVQGPKNFIFIFGLVMPIILTLVLSLVFGTFFSGKPRLGVVDPNDSQVTTILNDNPALVVRPYSSAAALEDAAARGAIDLGMVLPAAFDQRIQTGTQVEMTTYLWGESLLEHRITIGTAILQAVRQTAGQEAPVDIQQIIVGDVAAMPWQQRIMPIVVLMAIMMAGLMVPATSLVSEKSNRTLTALSVSPVTLFEVFAAKGVLGMLMSMFGGVMILILNRAFTGNIPLLLLVLLMGSTLSALAGVLLGAAIRDINSLFAIMKGLGILLYGPGLVKMFPEVPQWIGQLFPTYYMLEPVLQITQHNASFADIIVEIVVLSALIVALLVIIGVVSQRTREVEAAA
jgi:ABC-2 type transport system permease protein